MAEHQREKVTAEHSRQKITAEHSREKVMAEGKGGAAQDTIAGWKEFYEPIGAYAAAFAGTQHEAQKQVSSAYLSYLDHVRRSFDQPAVHDAVRAYAELLKVWLAPPTDSGALAEIGRHYAKVAQDAQGSVDSRLQVAGATLHDEIQKASEAANGAQLTELEKLIKSLQTGLSRLDPRHADAASLTLAGHALLFAATLRAHSM